MHSSVFFDSIEHDGVVAEPFPFGQGVTLCPQRVYDSSEYYFLETMQLRNLFLCFSKSLLLQTNH